MAVTRLQRKELRNVAKAKARVSKIKHLSKKPVIKNVDIEAIKAEFEQKVAGRTTKKATKAAEVVETTPEGSTEASAS